MNLHLLLQMAADAMGDRVAITSGDMSLRYAELNDAARACAGLVGDADRLGYFAEHHPAFPAALFGAAIAGRPFVSLNYRLQQDQINRQLERIAPAALITNRDVEQDGIITTGPDEALKAQTLQGDVVDSESGVAIELFTSGTTGEPKSALLRHANLMAYIFNSVEFMSAGEDEANLCTVPPYHIAGIVAVLSSVYAGRRIVQLPNFSAEGWVALARRECVTNAFMVPTMLQRIIDKHDRLDLPDLRNVSYGGGKMPLRTIRRAMELLPHVNFTNAYGLTETSATICVLTPDDHRAALESDDPLICRRLGSAGQPFPTIELQVRDEDGKRLGPDEVGLIHVRGEQVSGEYKGLGSQLDSDGWFLTKDRGFVDSDGYLFIDGRADDVIVRGGENISPGEIEEVLREFDVVEDVAVVAIPDEEWGEGIAVVIVAGDGLTDDDIHTRIRERLRSSRTPSLIKRVDQLPYNETGKLLRRVVRDDLVN